PVALDTNACGREVVEGVRVADVLQPDGESDAALHSLAVREVARAAGKLERIVRRTPRRERQRRAATDHFGDGRGSLDGLIGDDAVAVLERVSRAELDRIDAQRGGELVHLRFVAE